MVFSFYFDRSRWYIMYFLTTWRLVRPVNTQLQKDNVSPTFTAQCIWCVSYRARLPNMV